MTTGTLISYFDFLKRNHVTYKISKMVMGNIRNLLKCTNDFLSFLKYWFGFFIPKDKRIWVFTSFRRVGFLDNTKYMFLYVAKNCREINAFFITDDDEVISKLRQENLNVFKANSFGGLWVTARAGIAFTDHYKATDWNGTCVNYRTKIVQLWHGVGLKDLDNLEQSKGKGIQYSDDILSNGNDPVFIKIRKAIKFIFHAHYREFFERYFLLLAQGEESAKALSGSFHTPSSSLFISGYPRLDNILTNTSSGSHADLAYNILYAPTFRWNNESGEKQMLQLMEACHNINSTMESLGSYFYIRLHPHTWGAYKDKLASIVETYPRIKLDNEKDIYDHLGMFDILISDYSSIVYDYLLLDRPLIFYCFDYEDYIKNECRLKFDYYEHSPGPKVRSWEEVMKEIKIYKCDPAKDSQFRKRIRNIFYDSSIDLSRSSQAIVSELQKRLE